MNTLELYIFKNTDFQKIDLINDFDVSLNFNIQNVKDISLKKSSYSNKITLPGSKNNNLILGDMNLGIPHKFILNDNGKKLFSGYIRIETKVVYNEQHTEYECNLYSEVLNFFDLVGDKLLSDLDFSKYNHELNFTNISNSFTDICIVNNTVEQLQKGYGYVYTVIDKGGLLNEYGWIYLEKFSIALKVYEIFKKIAEDANYSISSNFLEGEFFKKLIIPINNYQKLAKQDINDRGFISTLDPSGSTTARTILIKQQNIKQAQPNNWTPITPVRFDYEISDSYLNNFDPTQYAFICRRKGKYKFYGKYGAEIKMELRYSNGGLALNKTLEINGGAELQVRMSLKKYDASDNLISDLAAASSSSIIKTDLVGNYVTNGTDAFLRDPDGTPANTEIFLTIDYNFDCEDIIEVGQKVKVCIEVLNPEKNPDNSIVWYSIPQPDYNDYRIYTYVYEYPVLCDFSGTYISDTIYENDIVDCNQVFDKNFKQADFIKNIQKLFNLYIEEDKNINNNLIIEPRDEFFQSENTLLDWTPKVDIQKSEFERINDLNERIFNLKYSEDIDTHNVFYLENSSNKLNYGQLHLKGQYNTNTNEETNIDISFAPTPLSYLNNNGNYQVCSVIQKIEEDNSVKDNNNYKPRILLYKNFDLGSNYMIVKAETLSLLTTFPYSGHLDDPYDDQIDLNFDGLEFMYINKSDLTGNNLFNLYYKNEILNYYSDSKLLRTKILLSSDEISRLNLRNRIIVGNKLYTINSIKNWVKGQLCEIELVELKYFNQLNERIPLGTQRVINSAGIITNATLQGNTVVNGSNFTVNTVANYTNIVNYYSNVYNYANVYNSGDTYVNNLYTNVNNEFINYTTAIGSGNLKTIRATSVIENDFQSSIYQDITITTGGTLTIKPLGELVIFDGNLINNGTLVLDGTVKLVSLYDYKPYLISI